MAESSIAIQKKIIADIAQLVTLQTRTNAYIAQDINTAVAMANVQLGFSGRGYLFRALIIEASDIAYTIRLDKSGADAINIPANRILILRNHDFKEVYITHAGAGAATFTVTAFYNTKLPAGSSD